MLKYKFKLIENYCFFSQEKKFYPILVEYDQKPVKETIWMFMVIIKITSNRTIGNSALKRWRKREKGG